MMVIREMLKKLEAEQQAHLEQLAKMEEQTRLVTSLVAAILVGDSIV